MGLRAPCLQNPPTPILLPASLPLSFSLSLSRLISSNILSPLRSGIFNPLTLNRYVSFCLYFIIFLFKDVFCPVSVFPVFAVRGPFSLSHPCLGNKRLKPCLWPPMRAGIKLLPSSKCKYKSHCQVKHPRGLKVSPLQHPPPVVSAESLS